MLSMRKFLAVLFAGLMLFSGAAMATPPDHDPTCDSGEGQQSGEECPGDNGSPGCEGVQNAEGHAPEQADPAFDLVTDILSEGAEGECEEDQRSSDRPGGRPDGS